VDSRTGKTLVSVDPRYFRPTEVDLLVGDPTKAREKLGWTHTTSFDDLVAEMVESDIHDLQLEQQHDKSHLRVAFPQWQEGMGRRPPRDGRVRLGTAARIRAL
ncbi:MAG: GDP-mannose 4,6-dehydratase, partial [Methylobacteriaceae bacterium]|nr:GDP-mannose 4,6-dehydratase [Methylobacteriaceae bacterium]